MTFIGEFALAYISIHALRKESDWRQWLYDDLSLYFNPRSP